MAFSPENSPVCPTLQSQAFLCLSPSSAASSAARPCGVGDPARELVSLPVPSLIVGDPKTAPSPGWLVPAGTDTASPHRLEVPGELGHFFRVELHFNFAWELGLSLWGALYTSGNASSLANARSALQLLRSLL